MCWVIPPASAAHDIDSNDAIEQRRLTMVDVSQKCNHGRTRCERLFRILLLQIGNERLFQGGLLAECDVQF